MTLFELIFGRRPKAIRPHDLATIETPPENADWRAVRPRRLGRVSAELAREDGAMETEHGTLSYSAGEHYIVTSRDNAKSVVRKDIFEKTYRKRLTGGYEKRPDVIYRYFTLDRPAMIKTPEGPQRAEPGDWIMQGVVGEMWPVSAQEAERKYAPA
ncbi:hypothetical protein U91I_03153 [alpha proteobacterium U9-1i]|nr:hypothetical protein U91I_03153 [alpha proteobacterium U9-1i]